MDMKQKRMRHQRFWQPLSKGEGAYLAVTSPVSDSGSLPCQLDPPTSLQEKWLSTDYCLRRAEANLQNTFWGQDAIPNVFVNFGPGVQAALLGAPYSLQPNSIWFDLNPPIKNWDRLPELVTNMEHELYIAIEDHTRSLCRASDGRYTVSFTDIGGQLDVLFSLRGEQLLTDLIEYPDQIMAAEKLLDDAFIAYFQTLEKMIGPSGCGYSGWIPLIHDKPWYPLQCDMSVMISPAMFEKFVLPSLDRVSAAIGQSVYHLDGPEEIRHLSMILSLPHVHAIQWVPLPQASAGKPGSSRQDFADELSLDVYRRTLAAGKKVVLLGVHPEQIPLIFDTVGSDGVFIQSNCSTRCQAEDLIATARRNWLKL